MFILSISASGEDKVEADEAIEELFPKEFPVEFPEELPDEDKCPEDIFIPCPEFTGDVITGVVEKLAALAAWAAAITCGPKWAAK